ncbi:hypothetical protein MTR67_016289 [Solanum verrucosum]|uniref:Bet v I/Major latex protein domain-containing protein n=1 Tax=Solanum verrucosum TaxID=315347 RepID=A0AAF0QFU4_SOLVR|nr:hypothetical protein MTR67_016289 [Solanum verrucosum]
MEIGGHLIRDLFHTKPHTIPNIIPSKILSFGFHEDGNDKIAKQVIEAVDPQTKSITLKLIGGELLELYDSFTVIISSDQQWTTWTFLYEKKTEETPEPLGLLGFVIGLTKDIEGHLLK